METKICSKCQEEKEVCEFSKNSQKKDGLHPSCKDCCKDFYNKNKQLILDRNKLWRITNPEIKKNSDLKYRLNNPDNRKKSDKLYREKNLETIKLRKKVWRTNNPEYQTQYEKKRKSIDFLFKLNKSVRGRIYKFLKLNNIIKTNRTFDIVGCSPEFLKEHIENQFIEEMSWDNYGFYGWHIDHIIPLSSAKTEEEVYRLCHYTNLQPLWAKDNLSKGDKILV
jgi:hypothetical protein